ncbi:hypothetical protein BCON_0078g00240 [Botryotinia convoluta]|uniref:Uncharacterized protein n=1 Tax=Botryotinia convoluta TaxID=54673 RepID=A0A4Z1II99_9HELO|nr:hypothetical protein BCON_0078g00240 [Botryotinia convoluta]
MAGFLLGISSGTGQLSTLATHAVDRNVHARRRRILNAARPDAAVRSLEAFVVTHIVDTLSYGFSRSQMATP